MPQMNYATCCRQFHTMSMSLVTELAKSEEEGASCRRPLSSGVWPLGLLPGLLPGVLGKKGYKQKHTHSRIFVPGSKCCGPPNPKISLWGSCFSEPLGELLEHVNQGFETYLGGVAAWATNQNYSHILDFKTTSTSKMIYLTTVNIISWVMVLNWIVDLATPSQCTVSRLLNQASFIPL